MGQPWQRMGPKSMPPPPPRRGKYYPLDLESKAKLTHGADKFPPEPTAATMALLGPSKGSFFERHPERIALSKYGRSNFTNDAKSQQTMLPHGYEAMRRTGDKMKSFGQLPRLGPSTSEPNLLASSGQSWRSKSSHR